MQGNIRKIALLFGALAVICFSHAGEQNITERSLLELAAERFADNLTPAERELFRATEKGEAANFTIAAKIGHTRYPDDTLTMLVFSREDDPANASSWSTNRMIRASCIQWLCADSAASSKVKYRGVRIIGARVEGVLDLTRATILFPVLLEGCHFDSDIFMRDCHLPTLSLNQTHVRSLHGQGLTVDSVLSLGMGFTMEGDLWLTRAAIGKDLDMRRAKCHGGIMLTGATIGGDFIANSAEFNNTKGFAIIAESAKFENSVVFKDGFKAEGGMRMAKATINGDLDCGGAQFIGRDTHAFFGDKLKVGGSVFFTSGFKAAGQIRLLNANIAADLNCSGGYLSYTNDYCMVADGIKVGGTIMFREGFQSEGMIHFLDTTIDGLLDCTGGTFRNRNGCAIAFSRSEIKRSVFLSQGFQAEGEIDFEGAAIGGDLSCNTGRFINPGGRALNAMNAQINGTVHLDGGFTAEGQVVFNGTTVKGSFSCTGGRFLNSTSTAFAGEGLDIDGALEFVDFQMEGVTDLLGARVRRYFFWSHPASVEKITLLLSSAEVGTLADSEDGWPNPGHLVLVGFTYKEIFITSPKDSESRLRWLGRQPTNLLTLQPYEELAGVFRNMGYSDDAAKIMVAKNQDYARTLHWYSISGLWYKFIGWFAGYGYLPSRAFLFSLFFITVGGWLFLIGRDSGYVTLVEPEKVGSLREANHSRKIARYYIKFETWLSQHLPKWVRNYGTAFVYSFETFVPLLNLGVASSWTLKEGKFLGAYFLFHRIFGGVLTTLWIGALTGLVKT